MKLIVDKSYVCTYHVYDKKMNMLTILFTSKIFFFFFLDPLD